MSGGHFNHNQSYLQIAEDIQIAIDNNDDTSLNEWGNPRGRGYSPEVISKLNAAVKALRIAYVYAQRADWLLSDDDGEESFLRRLGKELRKLNEEVD